MRGRSGNVSIRFETNVHAHYVCVYGSRLSLRINRFQFGLGDASGHHFF